MEFARSTIWGMAGALLITVAGCVATTRPAGLSDSAERLDITTQVLAEHSDSIGPPYQYDAHDLAKRAHEFRGLVDTATVSDADVQAQFDLVSQTYRKMRADAEHANTQQAYSELEPVTTAYRDVRHDLRRADDADTGG